MGGALLGGARRGEGDGMAKRRAVDPLGALWAARSRHEAAIARLLGTAVAARRQGTEAALVASERALRSAERAGRIEANALSAWRAEQRAESAASAEEDGR